MASNGNCCCCPCCDCAAAAPARNNASNTSRCRPSRILNSGKSNALPTDGQWSRENSDDRTWETASRFHSPAALTPPSLFQSGLSIHAPTNAADNALSFSVALVGLVPTAAKKWISRAAAGSLKDDESGALLPLPLPLIPPPLGNFCVTRRSDSRSVAALDAHAGPRSRRTRTRDAPTPFKSLLLDEAPPRFMVAESVPRHAQSPPMSAEFAV
mmetsp:Transcript_12648/g.27291  ORF Transcript_12648/g.27291 Transcript_12648/m.27291 type:complete len:213 (+) Transcript_12648:416-1054(+)